MSDRVNRALKAFDLRDGSNGIKNRPGIAFAPPRYGLSQSSGGLPPSPHVLMLGWPPQEEYRPC